MPSLIEIEGIGPSLAAACVKKNYRTIAKIAAATPKELAAVPGITEKSAPQIIESAKLLLPGLRIQESTTSKKRRAVPPVKVAAEGVAAKTRIKTKAKSTDSAKAKSDRKASKKSSTKPAAKEENMSASDVKDKVKKLKKKIKELKEKKKKILKKENKKIKKEKKEESKKSVKKSSKKK